MQTTLLDMWKRLHSWLNERVFQLVFYFYLFYLWGIRINRQITPAHHSHLDISQTLLLIQMDRQNFLPAWLLQQNVYSQYWDRQVYTGTKYKVKQDHVRGWIWLSHLMDLCPFPPVLKTQWHPCECFYTIIAIAVTHYPAWDKQPDISYLKILSFCLPKSVFLSFQTSDELDERTLSKNHGCAKNGQNTSVALCCGLGWAVGRLKCSAVHSAKKKPKSHFFPTGL